MIGRHVLNSEASGSGQTKYGDAEKGYLGRYMWCISSLVMRGSTQIESSPVMHAQFLFASRPTCDRNRSSLK